MVTAPRRRFDVRPLLVVVNIGTPLDEKQADRDDQSSNADNQQDDAYGPDIETTGIILVNGKP
jgi:hypothetical protein